MVRQDDPRYARLLGEIEKFWKALPDKPEETPVSILAALWLTTAGIPTSTLKAAGTALPDLDDDGHAQLGELIDLKRAGRPVAHLTGRQHFMGLEMLSGPDALIPRSETEILGRAAVAKLKEMKQARGDVRVIDLCTGSGNLALAYAVHVPGSRISGADLSEEAVALAVRNAAHLGLAGVEFRQSDLFGAFESPEFLANTDLVTCNPPYISAAKVPMMHPEISEHEPRLAFDGGMFGIGVLSRFVNEVPRFLKPQSWMGFEVGLGQGPTWAKRLRDMAAYGEVETYTDAEGNIRALFARTR